MADPLHTLLVGLKAVWVTKSAVGQPLNSYNIPHRSRKPPGDSSTCPYINLETEPSVHRFNTSINEYWDHRIAFVIYAATPEAASTVAGVIQGVFDSDSLAITLGQGVKIYSQASRIDHQPEDKVVNSVRLEYEFRTSKPRTS